MKHSFQYDVFLSYNSSDRIKVGKIAQKLSSDGVCVWFDEWIIKAGDDIIASIDKGMQKSRIMVCFLTAAALKSDWVTFERNCSLFRDPSNGDRRFIPVLISDCWSEVPKVLRRIKYIDLRRITKSRYEELLDLCLPNGKRRLKNA